MRGVPEVPAPDVEQYGLNILTPDESPLAQYPETVKDAIARLVLGCLLHTSLAYLLTAMEIVYRAYTIMCMIWCCAVEGLVSEGA